MTSLKQKLRLIVSTLVLALFAYNAQSAVLIDGFTDSQYLLNGIQSTDRAGTHTITELGITNTLLGNVQRTFRADSLDTGVIVNSGVLSVATHAIGGVSINYSFDPINLAAFAKAIALNISLIDLNVEVQMIANGSSSYGFHDFGGEGKYLVDFSQFTDSSVFADLHSLELKFRGVKAWDAEFELLATDTKVPEPSVTALLLIGMMAITLVARRRAVAA